MISPEKELGGLLSSDNVIEREPQEADPEPESLTSVLLLEDNADAATGRKSQRDKELGRSANRKTRDDGTYLHVCWLGGKRRFGRG